MGAFGVLVVEGILLVLDDGEDCVVEGVQVLLGELVCAELVTVHMS